jgi:hypothetical protein
MNQFKVGSFCRSERIVYLKCPDSLQDTQTIHNTGMAEVSVQRFYHTFMGKQTVVYLKNICGENHHLCQARNRPSAKGGLIGIKVPSACFSVTLYHH